DALPIDLLAGSREVAHHVGRQSNPERDILRRTLREVECRGLSASLEDDARLIGRVRPESDGGAHRERAEERKTVEIVRVIADQARTPVRKGSVGALSGSTKCLDQQ